MYHGSNTGVAKPIYGFGKDDRDYGSGFYTTIDKQQAINWASLYGGSHPKCNEYLLDTNGLKICDLDKYGALAWIAEVLYHRVPEQFINYEDAIREMFVKKYRVRGIENFDVIYGYRADDSYFQIIVSFLSNQITVPEVVNYFMEGRLGKQVCIKSKKAFSAVKFVRAENVPVAIKNQKAVSKDIEARKKVVRALKDRANAIMNKQYKINKYMTYEDCVSNTYKFDIRSGKYYV